MTTDVARTKLYARDLVALSDADLDVFLAQLRAEGGGIAIIAVEDPQNLPTAFIERLRYAPPPCPVASPEPLLTIHSAGIEQKTGPSRRRST
jgi:hypothetical protein